MKNILIYAVVSVFALIALAFILGIVRIQHVEELSITQIEGSDPIPGYCLESIHPYGEGEFSISENTAGKYQYQMIATTRGIEVWRECK